MYLKSGVPDQCTGCFACMDVCPVGAVSKVMRDDSFLYPVIDSSQCVHCGRCESVCTSGKAGGLLHSPIDCFAGIINNPDSFFASSSGGAFEAAVRAIREISPARDLYVVGAIWDEDCKVLHSAVRYSGPESLRPLNKSKYVQSDTSGIYRKVEEWLQMESTAVIFSGCPCQAAALRNYLGRDFDNLWIIDIICKGAPSQAFFDQYKAELEASEEARLIRYSFRNKRILENGTLYTRSAYYALDNGAERTVTRFTDPFLRIFYQKAYHMRPSCLCCQYKTIKRISDITIGDAWGIEKMYEEINPIRGVSLVLINTERAARLREHMTTTMRIYDCDLAFAVENNAALRETECQ